MADQSNITISKDTIRRLVRDIKELNSNPLHSHGIYYIHDEEDILTGKALIIGPSDTVYENGFYFFEFNFPYNSPHSPPDVKFCTFDGETRFNPNLYVQGKVCLSILNTWQGEQWSGCQTISSVLLAICTLLNNEPLLNEPGITKTHVDFNKYNKIINYKNFDTAIIGTMKSEYIKDNFPLFLHLIRDKFLSSFDHNINKIKTLCETYPNKERVQTSIYKMNIKIDYVKLLDKFNNIKSEINDII